MRLHGCLVALNLFWPHPAIAGSVATLTTQKERYSQATGEVIVRLSARVDSGTPVTVRPLSTGKRAKRDVPYQVFFRFSNLTDRPQRIRAIHQISPAKAEDHFKKLACFCFENQTLAPYESKDEAVIFVVDSQLPMDVEMIDLAYVVFRSPREDRSQAQSRAEPLGTVNATFKSRAPGQQD